jgi:cytoskeletal protein CcmA (bactofilin family)
MPETPRQNANDSGPSEIHAYRPAPASQGQHEGHILVGEGVTMKGDILKCRVIEIHGTVEGDLEADVLIVHEKGLLTGNAKIDRAEVHGSIDGDIRVKDLLAVTAKGTIIGKTEYGKLSVETGGCLVGVLNKQSAKKPKLAGVPSHRRPTDSTFTGRNTVTRPKYDNWYV